MWFWTTPVVYLVDSLPAFAMTILKLNPAFYYVRALHDLLYYHVNPTLGSWCAMFAASSLALVLGYSVYRRALSQVRDEL